MGATSGGHALATSHQPPATSHQPLATRYGDSAGDLRPATSRDAFSGDGMASRDGVALAHEVFGSDEDTNPDQLSAALRSAKDERG